MRVTLVGPCSPSDISHLFYKDDALRARGLIGYRGVPVSLLAEAIHKLGHEVFIVTSASIPADSRQKFVGEKIELRVISQRPRARDLAFSFFKKERNLLLHELSDIDCDIIHAHWTYEFALAALATGKPVLVTAHDAPLTIFRYLFDPYRFFRLLMACLTRSKIQYLSTVSPYLLSRWKKEMFWRKVTPVIPNIAPFTIATDVEYHETATRVLTISDGGKRKNVKTLLKAWPSVLEQNPNVRLELVGHGLGSNDDLAIWAAKNHFDQSVIWHGYLEREQISNLLAITDVLVHPSLEEAQPMVPLEAMCFGIPIIGGVNSGGVPWTVKEAGILVNVRSSKEIAGAINRLLVDKNLRQKLGARGQVRVKREFSPEAVAKQYMNYYKSILEFNKSK